MNTEQKLTEFDKEWIKWAENEQMLYKVIRLLVEKALKDIQKANREKGYDEGYDIGYVDATERTIKGMLVEEKVKGNEPPFDDEISFFAEAFKKKNTLSEVQRFDLGFYIGKYGRQCFNQCCAIQREQADKLKDL